MRRRWVIVALTTALTTSGGAAAAKSVDPPEAGSPTGGVNSAVEQGASPLPPPKGP